jgi:acyl-coenzyme A thioesterase PaaI-like protein
MTAPVASPPVPGNWHCTEVTNTGAWTVGPIWLDRDAGRFALLIGPQHCNALLKMNGGAMATFLDGQAVAVTDLPLDPGKHTPTISLHVDYLAPPAVGDWLVADVVNIKTTRTMIFTQAVVSVGDRVVARSHAIYSNTQGKASP